VRPGEAEVGTNSGNNAYVIAAKSKHPALAAEYLNFIGCTTQAANFFLKNGQIPLYLPADASSLVPAGSSTSDWLNAWNTIRQDNGSIMFMDLSTLQGTNVIGQTIQELTGLQLTPKQAISQIEADYSQFHSTLGN
jgi:raffinose/stachyose/melibiose transport system substrate-binding protein